MHPEVAKLQQPYAGMRFEFHIERLEPMSLLSFRWHPVEFRLESSAAPVFAALGDEARLHIVSRLCEAGPLWPAPASRDKPFPERAESSGIHAGDG